MMAFRVAKWLQTLDNPFSRLCVSHRFMMNWGGNHAPTTIPRNGSCFSALSRIAPRKRFPGS